MMDVKYSETRIARNKGAKDVSVERVCNETKISATMSKQYNVQKQKSSWPKGK